MNTKANSIPNIDITINNDHPDKRSGPQTILPCE